MNSSKTITDQVQQQYQSLQELKLNVAKVAIHGTERVLLSFIDRAFAYQETVDSLLVQASISENGERIVELAQIQADIAKHMIDETSKRLEQVLNNQVQISSRPVGRSTDA